MDPDNSYREEAPVSMASRSADDENDSNPPRRSLNIVKSNEVLKIELSSVSLHYKMTHMHAQA